MSWEPPIPEVEDAMSEEELEERLNWLEFVWEERSGQVENSDPVHRMRGAVAGAIGGGSVSYSG